MRKSKSQAVKKYSPFLDSTLKEKLEFVKTQSMLFQKTLPPPEKQNELCQWVIQCFKQSAMMFPTKKSSKEVVGEAREWTTLSINKKMKQILNQEKMRQLCQSIFADIVTGVSDTLPEGVVIDFENECITWHEQTFLLDDSVIEIEFLSTDPYRNTWESFDHPLGDKIKATIYMQEKKGSVRAFMKATGDNGQDYFFELKHFSMLFLLDRDRQDLNEVMGYQEAETAPSESSDTVAPKEGETNSEESVTPYISKESGDTGMFILFSMRNQTMFVTTY